MFDIDAGKILVVGVVALLVIGPKDLPRVLRTVGQTVGKMRRMASEFQNQFMEAIKEADLEDIKKEINAVGEAAKIDASFDPASMMRTEITTAVERPREIGHSVIDLTGEAAAHPDAEIKEIAPPTHDPAHEALLSGPVSDEAEALADRGEIGQGVGEAAANTQAETKEIAPAEHVPAGEALLSGPLPGEGEAQAGEAEIGRGAGDAVRLGDRG